MSIDTPTTRRDRSCAHLLRTPLARVLERCRRASRHLSGGVGQRVQEMLSSYTHPPIPPLARVTEGDPRGGVGQRVQEMLSIGGVGQCVQEEWSIGGGNSARMGPPGRLKASLGPPERQAIASEFVSRGSRSSPLAHGARHVAPGRAGRARGGRGASEPRNAAEANVAPSCASPVHHVNRGEGHVA